MNSRITKVIDLPITRKCTTGEVSPKELVTNTGEEKIVRTSSATVAERTNVAVAVHHEETETKELTPVKKIRIRECSDLRRWWDEDDQQQESCECA